MLLGQGTCEWPESLPVFGSRALAMVTHKRRTVPQVPFEASCRIRHETGPTLEDIQLPKTLLKPPYGGSRPSIASQGWELIVWLGREIHSFTLPGQCVFFQVPGVMYSDTNLRNSAC